jgi:hypothetical protein
MVGCISLTDETEHMLRHALLSWCLVWGLTMIQIDAPFNSWLSSSNETEVLLLDDLLVGFWWAYGVLIMLWLVEMLTGYFIWWLASGPACFSSST